MYLNWDSFRTRWKHENLHVIALSFKDNSQSTKENEEEVKSILSCLKFFNKNKNVLNSCVQFNNRECFMNTGWVFGFDTVDILQEFKDYMLIICDYGDEDFVTNYEGAECPFKNNGELV